MGKISHNKTDDIKYLVYYHRAYKKILIPSRQVILKFILLTIPLTALIAYLFPELILVMNKFTRYALTFVLPPDMIEFLDSVYLLRNVKLIDFPTKYPQPALSFGLFLFSLLSVLVVLKIRIPRPIAMWIIFLSFINLSSAVFFILFPSIFPYETKQFTELYVMTEINIWFLIPLLMGLALLPLPSGTFSKFVVCVITLLYSVLFGIIRYAFFLIVVSKASFLFMSVLFFAFGPLMDFFYVVGIYSFYLSIISKKAKVDQKAWNWSY